MPLSSDPYRIKPKEQLVREEQKLIQIRDDSVRPPSSIGVDSFQATLFGAPALQPSKASTSGGDGSFFSGRLVVVLILLLPLALALKLTCSR